MDVKTKLKNSLYYLMQSMSFEEISVQLILDNSGVSRSTFYRQFQDKYDLMNWYYSSYVDEILLDVKSGDWQEKLQQIAQFMFDHRLYFQKAAKVNGDNSFWNFFYDYGYSFYRRVYLRNTGQRELDETARVALEFNCAGNVDVIQKWLSRDCDIPVPVLSKQIFRLIPDLFRQYLE